MTTCLEKSCSFDLPCAFPKLLSIYVFSYFPFGFEGRIWDLIVSVPDHLFTLHSPTISLDEPILDRPGSYTHERHLRDVTRKRRHI